MVHGCTLAWCQGAFAAERPRAVGLRLGAPRGAALVGPPRCWPELIVLAFANSRQRLCDAAAGSASTRPRPRSRLGDDSLGAYRRPWGHRADAHRNHRPMAAGDRFADLESCTSRMGNPRLLRSSVVPLNASCRSGRDLDTASPRLLGLAGRPKILFAIGCGLPALTPCLYVRCPTQGAARTLRGAGGDQPFGVRG
jgi:hypothetical protein